MDKAHVAFGAEIGLAESCVSTSFCSAALIAPNTGVAPLSGAVNADAKVDLVVARVGGVELDQREQRVGRLRIEVGQASWRGPWRGGPRIAT